MEFLGKVVRELKQFQSYIIKLLQQLYRQTQFIKWLNNYQSLLPQASFAKVCQSIQILSFLSVVTFQYLNKLSGVDYLFGKYNFMLAQQLNITDRQLQKEAEVNWTGFKNLYIQAGKTKSTPEPDHSDRSSLDWLRNVQSQMKHYFEEMFTKLNANNKIQIEYIQNKYQEEITDLKKRIERLEEVILSFRDNDRGRTQKAHSIQISQKNKPFSYSYKNQTFLTPHKTYESKTTELTSASTKVKPENPYIHIQQDQQKEDVSLLDSLDSQEEHSTGEVEHKKPQTQPYNRQRENKKEKQGEWREKIKRKLYQTTNRKQIINNQTQVTIIKQHIVIPDIIIRDEYTEPKAKTENIINVPCTVHDKILGQLRSQVQRLREYLRSTHQEDIQEAPYTQEVNELREAQTHQNPNPTILVNLSVNSQRHLQHENSKLRQKNESLLSQLKSARNKTRYVKNLLQGVLQISNHIFI